MLRSSANDKLVMDFAVYLTPTQTVVYQNSQGIVLNRKTTPHEFVNLCKNLGLGKSSVIFCIPSSLTTEKIDEYKALAYEAGIARAEFVPSAVASAVEIGYTNSSEEAGGGICISVFIGEFGTEVVVINDYGIIAGGTTAEGYAAAAEAVRVYLEKKYELNIDSVTAENAMKECQTLLSNDEVSYKVRAADGETGEAREVWFTGIECYKVLSPIYGKVAKAILLAIDECAQGISDAVKEGTVYVGGEANLPTGVREFFTVSTGMNIVLGSKGLNTAVSGAGKILSNEPLLSKIIKAN